MDTGTEQLTIWGTKDEKANPFSCRFNWPRTGFIPAHHDGRVVLLLGHYFTCGPGGVVFRQIILKTSESILKLCVRRLLGLVIIWRLGSVAHFNSDFFGYGPIDERVAPPGEAVMLFMALPQDLVGLFIHSLIWTWIYVCRAFATWGSHTRGRGGSGEEDAPTARQVVERRVEQPCWRWLMLLHFATCRPIWRMLTKEIKALILCMCVSLSLQLMAQ